MKGASPSRPQLSKAVSFEDGQIPDKSVAVLPRSKVTTAPLPKRHESDSDDNKDDDWWDHSAIMISDPFNENTGVLSS